jgi:hypothetical protein
MNLLKGLIGLIFILLFVFADRDEKLAHED